MIELLLQRGASYPFSSSTADSILHLTAKGGSARTLDILLAAELKGINPYAENRDDKTVTKLAQERFSRPVDSLEKVHELVMDIDTRNLRVAQIPMENPHLLNASKSWPIRAAVVRRWTLELLFTFLRSFVQDWRNISLLVLGIMIVVLSMRAAPSAAPVASSAVSKSGLSTSGTAVPDVLEPTWADSS